MHISHIFWALIVVLLVTYPTAYILGGLQYFQIVLTMVGLLTGMLGLYIQGYERGQQQCLSEKTKSSN